MRAVTKKVKKDLIKNKGLTQRECDIFFAVGSGLTNLEASIECHVTEGTVKFHLTNIFKKLNLTNRSKVVILAHGLEPL